MIARISATASSFHQLSPRVDRSSAAGKWICGTSLIAAYTPTALMRTLISRSATVALPFPRRRPLRRGRCSRSMLAQQEPRSEGIAGVEAELVAAGPERRAGGLGDRGRGARDRRSVRDDDGLEDRVDDGAVPERRAARQLAGGVQEREPGRR